MLGVVYVAIVSISVILLITYSSNAGQQIIISILHYFSYHTSNMCDLVLHLSKFCLLLVRYLQMFQDHVVTLNVQNKSIFYLFIYSLNCLLKKHLLHGRRFFLIVLNQQLCCVRNTNIYSNSTITFTWEMFIPRAEILAQTRFQDLGKDGPGFSYQRIEIS